jgi:DNA invertase Pin-like site-specific DNA recombinase
VRAAGNGDTKAAIYLRQSFDKTGEELAVDRQRDDALKLAERRDWNVVRVEIDNDISAAGKRHRPGFEAILTAIQRKEVGAVISWDMTRLTRNRRDTVRVIEAGERAGVVLAFVRGSDLDLSTPSGRMLADILASVARQEIEQKSDRQKRANMQAAEQGRRTGGRRPFGYETDGTTIRDLEAMAVRQAFDDVLAGVSLAQIARDWNAAGLRTPQKTRTGEPSKWIPTTVRGVLQNPRYAGLRSYTSAPEHGRRKVESVYPAQWPAIVSEETWRATTALLADPDRFTAPQPRRPVAADRHRPLRGVRCHGELWWQERPPHSERLADLPLFGVVGSRQPQLRARRRMGVRSGDRTAVPRRCCGPAH